MDFNYSQTPTWKTGRIIKLLSLSLQNSSRLWPSCLQKIGLKWWKIPFSRCVHGVKWGLSLTWAADRLFSGLTKLKDEHELWMRSETPSSRTFNIQGEGQSRHFCNASLTTAAIAERRKWSVPMSLAETLKTLSLQQNKGDIFLGRKAFWTTGQKNIFL